MTSVRKESWVQGENEKPACPLKYFVNLLHHQVSCAVPMVWTVIFFFLFFFNCIQNHSCVPGAQFYLPSQMPAFLGFKSKKSILIACLKHEIILLAAIVFVINDFKAVITYKLFFRDWQFRQKECIRKPFVCLRIQKHPLSITDYKACFWSTDLGKLRSGV